MKQRAFEIGVAIMMFGATAMDSEGIGWIIAAGMVVAGGVISFAAYASERLRYLFVLRGSPEEMLDYKRAPLAERWYWPARQLL